MGVRFHPGFRFFNCYHQFFVKLVNGYIGRTILRSKCATGIFAVVVIAVFVYRELKEILLFTMSLRTLSNLVLAMSSSVVVTGGMMRI